MKIIDVAKNSIAEELDIQTGDELLEVNGNVVRDIIDYSYLVAEDKLLLLLRSGQEIFEAEIEKFPEEDLGLSFEADGLGRKRVCKNKCIFCFVDQLPRGMRKSLYIKDDDWRLSFLMGNYITLTNLEETDIDRIIEQKLSPLYVSVHATEDAVREQMLCVQPARNTMDIIRTLTANDIRLHVQVVLCPGVNDGPVLDRTLHDLYALYPSIQSVTVVPVGITKHREGLYPLHVVTCEEGRAAISIVESMQGQSFREKNTRFCFASDELYLRAQMELPTYESYEQFDQIENGVGLIRKFQKEVRDALDVYKKFLSRKERFGIVTGMDFYPYMQAIVKSVQTAFQTDMTVYPVENMFWGESVTVTGLLTGTDIITQLRGRLGNIDTLLLCSSCFRECSDVLLDDVCLDDLSQALGVTCKIVEPDGYVFIEQLIETKESIKEV